MSSKLLKTIALDGGVGSGPEDELGAGDGVGVGFVAGGGSDAGVIPWVVVVEGLEIAPPQEMIAIQSTSVSGTAT